MAKTEHVHREDNTCSCGIVALEPDEKCPVHGGTRNMPPRCAECGQFMPIPWRGATYEDDYAAQQKESE